MTAGALPSPTPHRQGAPRGSRTSPPPMPGRYAFRAGLEVRRGSQHWEFPLENGAFRPDQTRWMSEEGIGVRGGGAHRAPRPGRPWWDDLLPWEV